MKFRRTYDTVSTDEGTLQPNETSRMLDVIIALIPAAFAGVAVFGIRAAAVMAICVVSCVLFEYLGGKFLHLPAKPGDLSAVVTGLLLAFSLPVSVPLWICIIGSFAAIIIIKLLFGGKGKSFLNPAITARLILFAGFIPAMTDFTAPARNTADAVSTATPLAGLTAIDLSGNINLQIGKLISEEDIPGFLNMLFGVRAGCIGEVCAAALLLGGVYLIFRGVISFTLPGAYILTNMVIYLAVSRFNTLFTAYMLLSGGLLLGAFFMMTDPETSPKQFRWKLILGIACGIITAIIRLFAPFSEGVAISILVMNIACIVIEKKQLTISLPFRENANEEIPEAATEEIPEAATEEIPEESAEEISEEVAEEIPEEATEEIPEESAEEIPEEVAEEIPEKVAEKISEEVAEEIPEEAAEDIHEEATEEIPEEVAEKISEEVAEEIPEEAAEEIPEKAAEEIPEEVTEEIPEEAAEDIHEEVAEEISEEAAKESTPDPVAIPEQKKEVFSPLSRKKNRKRKNKTKIQPDFSEPLPEVIPEFLRKEIEKNKTQNSGHNDIV